jgi:hypothetical protein
MTTATLTCEAVTGKRAGTWGWEPVTCGQSVALVTVRDAAGILHHVCSIEGHRADVVRRFGETVLPEEHTHFDDRDANGAECPACDLAEARA